jgi:hypothetical protein
LGGIISIANIAKIANIDWGGGNSEGCFEFLRDRLFNVGNVGNLGNVGNVKESTLCEP